MFRSATHQDRFGNPHTQSVSAARKPFNLEVKTLALGLLCSALTVAFALLASEVAEGDTHALDIHFARYSMGLRAAHPWVTEVMRDLSGLGSTVSLGLAVAIAVGYLALVRARSLAFSVAVAAGCEWAIMFSLKAWFARARPGPEFTDVVASGMSFPSGHATMSAMVFLTTTALLSSTRQRWAERVYIVLVGALLTVLVGVSRVALGVHWFTDVVGGWAIGTAWAIAWLLVVRVWLRPR